MKKDEVVEALAVLGIGMFIVVPFIELIVNPTEYAARVLADDLALGLAITPYVPILAATTLAFMFSAFAALIWTDKKK